MPRHKSPQLTEAELRLMHVLWRAQSATVADVLAALDGQPQLAYNTVLTTLRILEQKGYVTHSRAGRAFVYRAVVPQVEARRRAVRHLVSRLFDDSPRELVKSLLSDQAIDPQEVRKIRRLLGTSSAGFVGEY